MTTRDIPPGRDDHGGLHLPGVGDEHWARILAAAAELEGGRHHVFDRLWAMIPTYEHEEQYVPSSSASVTVTAKTVNPIIAKSVVWSIPNGATSGLLTLGDWTIPIQNTFGVISPLELWLDPTALRQVSWSGATGAAFLGITGQGVPTYSKE